MLTKVSAISKIEVTEDGVIQVRRSDRILEDGKKVSESYHRHCLEPGADLTGQDDRVIAVANAIWTPEVIAAYQAKGGNPA